MTRAIAPPPSRDSSSIVPPWRLTSRRTMAGQPGATILRRVNARRTLGIHETKPKPRRNVDAALVQCQADRASILADPD